MVTFTRSTKPLVMVWTCGSAKEWQLAGKLYKQFLPEGMTDLVVLIVVVGVSQTRYFSWENKSQTTCRHAGARPWYPEPVRCNFVRTGQYAKSRGSCKGVCGAATSPRARASRAYPTARLRTENSLPSRLPHHQRQQLQKIDWAELLRPQRGYASIIRRTSPRNLPTMVHEYTVQGPGTFLWT